MRQPVDVLVDATVNAVSNAGVVEDNARMAVVEAVHDDGTLDATMDDGIVPSVRILSGYYSPSVGDIVELLRTVGGWVCLGALRTTSHPLIQSGSLTISTTSGTWAWVTVSFPKPFLSVPVMSLTVNGNFASAEVHCAVRNVTATGFDAGVLRASSFDTPVDWIATAT